MIDVTTRHASMHRMGLGAALTLAVALGCDTNAIEERAGALGADAGTASEQAQDGGSLEEEPAADAGAPAATLPQQPSSPDAGIAPSTTEAPGSQTTPDPAGAEPPTDQASGEPSSNSTPAGSPAQGPEQQEANPSTPSGDTGLSAAGGTLPAGFDPSQVRVEVTGSEGCGPSSLEVSEQGDTYEVRFDAAQADVELDPDLECSVSLRVGFPAGWTLTGLPVTASGHVETGSASIVELEATAAVGGLSEQDAHTVQAGTFTDFTLRAVAGGPEGAPCGTTAATLNVRLVLRASGEAPASARFNGITGELPWRACP